MWCSRSDEPDEGGGGGCVDTVERTSLAWVAKAEAAAADAPAAVGSLAEVAVGGCGAVELATLVHAAAAVERVQSS